MLVGLFGVIPNLGAWLTEKFLMTGTQIGICYMEGGIGGILGNRFAGKLIRIMPKATIISISSVMMGIILYLFTNVDYVVVWAGILFGVLMFAGSLRLPAYQLILTESVPINLRGRLMSMNMIVGNFAMGIGGIWSTAIITGKNDIIEGMANFGLIALITSLPIIFLIHAVCKKTNEVSEVELGSINN